jgi:hypothetical protein
MDIWLLRSAGIVILVLFAIGWWYEQANQSIRLKKENNITRVVGLSFAGSNGQAQTMLQDEEGDHREAIRMAIHRDFFFIPAYITLYLLLSIILYNRPFPMARGFGIAAMAFTLATLIFDLAENLSVLRVLNSGVTDSSLKTLYWAAFFKWGTGAVGILFLTPLFFHRSITDFGNPISGFTAIISIIAGVSFVVSAAIILLGLRNYHWLSNLEIPTLTGALAMLLLCLFLPHQFLK